VTLKQKFLAISSIPLLALIIAACTQSESAANDSGVHYLKREGSDPNVVAKFEGKEITLEDLEKSSPDVFAARLDVYKAQKSALEDYVRNAVLERLAERAKLSVDDYMRREMEAAKKRISDREVEAFLKSKNVPDTSKVPAEVKDQVRGLLHVQKLVSGATRSNQVELYLSRPKAAPLNFNLEGEPSWGNADAPVTIVEYSDFQCYYCGQARTRLAELKKLYGRKLRIVYKHYPLPSHPEARPAAEASMCVNEQGSDKFWKYHDILFDNQKPWTKDDLMDYAKRVGADTKKFEECFDSKKYADHVDASIAEGQRLGVSSTPSFFVNSQLIKGAQPLAEFREIIDEAIN
jgi:protein-disulfide isomerase